MKALRSDLHRTHSMEHDVEGRVNYLHYVREYLVIVLRSDSSHIVQSLSNGKEVRIIVLLYPIPSITRKALYDPVLIREGLSHLKFDSRYLQGMEL